MRCSYARSFIRILFPRRHSRSCAMLAGQPLRLASISEVSISEVVSAAISS